MLTTEQELKLVVFKKKIKNLTTEQLQDMLVNHIKALMLFHNKIKLQLKEEFEYDQIKNDIQSKRE